MEQTLLGHVTLSGRCIHADYHDNGNSGTAITIDTDNGNYQKVTLTDNCTITLRSTTGIGTDEYTVPLVLLLVQDATGGRVVTWAGYGDGDVFWGSGQDGAVTTTASAEDLLFTVGLFSGAGSDIDWMCSIMHNFQ